MKQLCEDIVQQGYVSSLEHKTRKSCRAIVLNENKQVLMIYAGHYKDYTFPGGGVDDGESMEECLLRECMEETGAVLNNVREYGLVRERRLDNVHNFNIFESYYYLCDFVEFKEASLLDYEVALGYETRWVDINEAIRVNELAKENLKKQNLYYGVLDRANSVLRSLL